MITLYSAPRTRSVRILWLMEELGLPYKLERVEFRRTRSRFFQQETPTGKFPTLTDGEVVMCESGAIVEYILERYGEGRLEPAAGTPERALFLQWLHYAEATAFPPLGILVWLTLYRDDADEHAGLIEDTHVRAAAALQFLQDRMGPGPYLLGSSFTAADIMTGFTLIAAKELGVLDQRFPTLLAYLSRLTGRPAFARAMAAAEGRDAG